jgi:hypothetical protein
LVEKSEEMQVKQRASFLEYAEAGLQPEGISSILDDLAACPFSTNP